MRLGWLIVAISLWATSAWAHGSATSELERLDALLAKDRDNVELRLNRAELHRRRGDLGAALADLRVVAARHPNERRMLLERALVKIALGNADAALVDFDAALKADPHYFPALVRRAELLVTRGELELARADYDAAYRLKATPELALSRGKLDEKLGKLERAATGYERALKDLGGALVVRLALVDVERRRKRAGRAIELLDELVEKSPVKGEWLLLRGDVHADAGQSAQARRDRLRALRETDALLRKRPTLMLRITHARALLALGRRKAAVRELRQVLERSPRNGEAQALLAKARGGEAQ